jgi:hypothetical protein
LQIFRRGTSFQVFEWPCAAKGVWADILQLHGFAPKRQHCREGRWEVNMIDAIKKQNLLAAASGLFRVIAIILLLGLIWGVCAYLTAPSD